MSPSRPGKLLLKASLLVMLVAWPLLAAGCFDDEVVEAIAFDPRGNDEWLRGNAAEIEAWDALGAGKGIRAREKAEAVLKEYPGSLLANWVLAQVMHAEEGHHARARFLIARVRAMLEKRFGARPELALAATWHKRILESESEILGEMEDREGQLRVIAEHDALYAPSLKANSIWALMKLARFDEALKLAESLLYSDELYERISAYNGMMAIYDEMRDKTKSFEWGKKGIDFSQGRHCILLHNTALSALMLFKFKESEEFARRSLRAEYDDCPFAAYEHLVAQFVHMGEFQKAISSYRKLSTHPILPRYRPHFDKTAKNLLTELLFALGKYEQALEFSRIVFSAPDRVGMVSHSVEDVRFGHGVVYWFVLDARIRELRDEASIRSFGQRLESEWELQKLELKKWELERILRRLGVYKDILVVNLRPFMRIVKPWYAGGLARIFGSGVASAALAEARTLDEPHLDAAGLAYFDAIQAEYALDDGDAERARTLAEQALKSLVREHAILIARIRAVAVKADLQLGGDPGSPSNVSHLKAILQKFPMVIRYLDMRLPVAVLHDDAPLAAQAAKLFHDHRRFATSAEAPFRIDVTTRNEDAIEICLRAADGFQFGCKETKFDAKEPDPEVRAEKAVNAFVADIFSPRVELTSSDVNSLDGSPVRQTADEALEGVLKTKVIEEEKE